MNGAPPGLPFPMLRRLHASPHRMGATEGRLLVDPLGIATPAFVPMTLLPILQSFDGSADCRTITDDLNTSGIPVEIDTVFRIAMEMRSKLLLESPEVDAATAGILHTFMEGGVRPARHAGSDGYPKDPAALRQALSQMIVRAERDLHPTPRGLVAPHIDLARGAAGYQAAYQRLARSEPAELYVVFGTGHDGPMAPVTGLMLDWETPIGRLSTDQAFVETVHQQLGAPDPQDVLLHREEHSLELQMLFLRHVHQDREIQVAGFLTGTLPSTDGNPSDEPYVQRILGTFREAAARSGKRVCFVAGADLAHIGPDFGDPDPVSTARTTHLAIIEQQRLAVLFSGAPGPFHHAVVTGSNPDRVCSATSLFLTGSLAGGPAELLHYGQAIDEEGCQAVSFAAAVYGEAPGVEG